MREETVSPLSCVWIQHSVQRFFADSLGVDDMSDSFHTLKVLQSLEQHSPGCALAGPTRSHHHQAVVQVADLVQLENLHTQEPLGYEETIIGYRKNEHLQKQTHVGDSK